MSDNKPDWSKTCWRDMLVYQRKSMWREDTLDMLAAWMGMKPGHTVVDVGCGLGYLGYTYWEYFGSGGKYLGVDRTPELLESAREAALDWGNGGTTKFVESDAYALPVEDNAVDIAMCQALLMHLERPGDALAEMKRIVRPGGRVVCFEADNLSAQMTVPHWSLPELSAEEFLLSRKVYLLANKGRIKLGRGDSSIGRKIPHLMAQIGLAEVDVRLNDKVHFLEPPYESRFQRDAIEKLEKQFFDEERYRTMVDREREEFLAGGGTEEEHSRARALGKRYREALRKELDARTYFACALGLTSAVMGKKPE